MGTNFYARKPACRECGAAGPEIHLGKSSSGFHGYNKTYPVPYGDYEAWLVTTPGEVVAFASVLKLAGWRLVDEYGNQFEPAELLERVGRNPRQYEANLRWHDPRYHGPLEEFTWQSAGYTFSTGEWF